jgi:hypothetical protein
MKLWHALSRTGKIGLIAALIAAAAIIAFFNSGCVSPTIPEPVRSSEIAFEGENQNAGILKVWPDGMALITEKKKAEYDELVQIYGAGTDAYAIRPPVKRGEGLLRRPGKDFGYPEHGWVWIIDPEHLAYFRTFKQWDRSGRIPR